MSDEVQAEMAATLGADTLRYLPVESIARALRFDASQLCQACITGDYPTPHGERLYQLALENARGNRSERTYEAQRVALSAGD